MPDYIQNSFARKPAEATAGQVLSLNDADIDSRILQTAAGVDAGVCVAYGSDWRTCKAIADSTDAGLVAGATVYKSVKEPISATVRWAQKENVPVLRKGAIWMKLHGTIGDNVQDVYVVHENAGVVLAAGQLRADAGSGDFESTLLPGVMVRKGGSAAGLALCYFDLGPTGPQGPQGEQGEPG